MVFGRQITQVIIIARRNGDRKEGFFRVDGQVGEVGIWQMWWGCSIQASYAVIHGLPIEWLEAELLMHKVCYFE